MLYIYRHMVNSPGKHAGSLWISDGTSDVAGPFYERWRAEAKLQELEDADIPDLFAGLFDDDSPSKCVGDDNNQPPGEPHGPPHAPRPD